MTPDDLELKRLMRSYLELLAASGRPVFRVGRLQKTLDIFLYLVVPVAQAAALVAIAIAMWR